jgi:glycosyltransferase involved in cell wall biosynthesis
MHIIYCQRMIFPNSSAHAIHTGMMAANFADAGASVDFFPGVPRGLKACMPEFFRRLGRDEVPAKLRLRAIPTTQKGLYGLLFRASLWLTMRRERNPVCWASSVKEAVMALRLRGVNKNARVVFEIHHLISRLKRGAEADKLYKLEKLAFERADLVVFNCPTLQELARGYLPEPRDSLVSPLGFNERVIRPARDPDLPEPGQESGRIRLVYVGSLQPGKGVENLIHSLAILQGPYELTIIGGWPPYRIEPLKALARGLKVADRVTFTGLVAQDRLGDWLKDCDIYVIPISTGEDFFAPIKMYEALGFGMPIVSTPMPSLLSGLKDGENALFSRDTDPRSLARTLAALGENPDLRGRMRRDNLIRARGLTAAFRTEKLLRELDRRFGE